MNGKPSRHQIQMTVLILNSRKMIQDPTSVDFYFLKTGKSKGEGVFISHGDTIKFTKNNMNRQETIHYYTCARKLTYKCTARAIITREVDVDEDGKDVVKIRLVEVATPEVGG